MTMSPSRRSLRVTERGTLARVDLRLITLFLTARISGCARSAANMLGCRYTSVQLQLTRLIIGNLRVSRLYTYG